MNLNRRSFLRRATQSSLGLGVASLLDTNAVAQSFVDFLKGKNLPLVDMMDAHLEDFAKYKIDVKDYLAQYYIGHYNPRGNHFCAFSIKDRLLKMLDPKPVPYRKDATILP